MPLTDTPTQRPRSPIPGRSTFTTSAPWSAMSAAAYGPVSAMEKSRTRMPRSGPLRSVTGSAERAGITQRRDLGVVVPQHVAQHGVGVLALFRRLARHRQLLALHVQREQQHVGAGFVVRRPLEPILELRVVAHRLRGVRGSDRGVVLVGEVDPLLARARAEDVTQLALELLVAAG